jgi:hypothetical protein
MTHQRLAVRVSFAQRQSSLSFAKQRPSATAGVAAGTSLNLSPEGIRPRGVATIFTLAAYFGAPEDLRSRKNVGVISSIKRHRCS